MEPENNLSPNALLEIENRQYNETNLLYHTTAALFGLSDTMFWVLYSLYGSNAPQTQAQMSAGWCLPKQTLNSAVRGMVEQGLVMLTPAPGCRHGKNLWRRSSGQKSVPCSAWGWNVPAKTWPWGQNTCISCRKNLRN